MGAGIEQAVKDLFGEARFLPGPLGGWTFSDQRPSLQCGQPHRIRFPVSGRGQSQAVFDHLLAACLVCLHPARHFFVKLSTALGEEEDGLDEVMGDQGHHHV